VCAEEICYLPLLSFYWDDISVSGKTFEKLFNRLSNNGHLRNNLILLSVTYEGIRCAARLTQKIQAFFMKNK